MEKLSKDYWDQRYREKQTGWDIGDISRPIQQYVDQLTDKTMSILIPGAGNAYEAEYLYSNGFKNVHVIDLSAEAIKLFQSRFPKFPEEQLYCGNFFDHRGGYDLIIEQTFFCALDPTLRDHYVEQCHNLLNEGGKVVGLLFKFPLTDEGPPFGGSQKEYNKRFSNKFDIITMEECYNSIPPRAGSELFIQLVKK